MKKILFSTFTTLIFIAGGIYQANAQDISGSIGAIKRGGSGRGTIVMSVPGGLHVNSSRPNSEYAIPTSVKISAVGAKVGGTMALHLAARHPSRVSTVSVLSSPTRGEYAGDRYRAWVAVIEKTGVEGWARDTMAKRLGAKFPPAGIEWWIQLMGRTATSTQLGFIGAVPKVDISQDLLDIRCPAQIITTQDNPLYPVEMVRAWQQKIARSELLVLAGDSYHVAATEPVACANAVLDFIRRHAA